MYVCASIDVGHGEGRSGISRPPTCDRCKRETDRAEINRDADCRGKFGTSARAGFVLLEGYVFRANFVSLALVIDNDRSVRYVSREISSRTKIVICTRVSRIECAASRAYLAGLAALSIQYRGKAININNT